MVCQGGCEHSETRTTFRYELWSFICFLIVAVSGVLACLLSQDLYVVFASITLFAGILAVSLFLVRRTVRRGS